MSILLSSSLVGQTYLVSDYGAIGDGSTINTASIQAAIDDCNANGGGEVVIAGGNFLSGTIWLKDGVNLRVDAGAELRGSNSISDYPDITPQIPTYVNNYTRKALIYAEGQSHIGISGEGRIDGQGSSFIGIDERPFGIRFVSCQNVTLEISELRNSGFWMMNLLDVDTLVIRNMEIFNHGNSNNDGLSLDGCRNVLIEDCTVDSNNDPIVLKTTSPAECENIEIRNCTVATWSRAIKIGTETHSGFRNIHIHDIAVVWSSLAIPLFGIGVASCGINLAIVDGGFMEDVTVENITMEGVNTALFIRLGNRGHVWEDGLPAPPVGYLRNVVLRNITAVQESNTTSSITGIPGHYAENITLENIDIEFPGGQSDLGTGYVVPENEGEKPESSIFGDLLPSYGLYIRHVDAIEMSDVCFRWQNADQRPGLMMEDVLNSANYTMISENDGGCVTISSGVSEEAFHRHVWVDETGMMHASIGQSQMSDLQIYDTLGQKVETVKDVSELTDLSWLPAGIYVADLGIGDDQFQFKFVR